MRISLLVLISPAVANSFSNHKLDGVTNPFKGNRRGAVCLHAENENQPGDLKRKRIWLFSDKGNMQDDHNDFSNRVSEKSHDDSNPVIHQIDHRATEKLSIAVSEAVTDKVVERQVEKLAERASGRMERYYPI